jgi:hypothetical protein
MPINFNKALIASFLWLSCLSCSDAEPESKLPSDNPHQSTAEGNQGENAYPDEEVVDKDFSEYESKGQDTSYTVQGLIDVVLTDGKVDTGKVLGRIFHTLEYANKSGGVAFTCENIAYLGTNILIPIPKGQVHASMYIRSDIMNKRYHFILINFKESISCKQYVINCNKDVYNYKELFVYSRYKENNSTQCALLLAVGDAYLKDIKTMVNINWQLGGPEDPFDHKGNLQFELQKRVPKS